MAEIRLDDDLIRLQKRADTTWALLHEIQDRYGRPSGEGGWQPEAHEEWQAAWLEWGERADTVRGAIDRWAQESGQSRLDVEARLRGEVRGGKNPQVWLEAA
ncbi:hypothetical protein [Streptomyces sp. NPDC058613]|uniref:hypothetical protein n=1 Tax=Streptomyces sp. NPDC058613 TaxID=3346556 RepID=UPI003665F358